MCELYKNKFTPCIVVMKGEISYSYLNQAVNMFIFAVNLGILTCGSIGIDSLLEPVFCGHSRFCSFWHFHAGFSSCNPIDYMLLTLYTVMCKNTSYIILSGIESKPACDQIISCTFIY